jgi:hypothetical protein
MTFYAFTSANETTYTFEDKISISDSDISIDFTVEFSESTNDLELKAILPAGSEVENAIWKWKIDGNEIGSGSTIHIPLALSGYTMSLELYSNTDPVSQISKTIQL